ncbi:helix-turn-helix domain-containing protein [Streptomyces jumonjinensis]|nr:response regulator transcription factor [Streptomyces jumonjinensis]
MRQSAHTRLPRTVTSGGSSCTSLAEKQSCIHRCAHRTSGYDAGTLRMRGQPMSGNHSRVRSRAMGLGGESGPGCELESLTVRELEVLSLLATGVSNRLLARRLGIAERTVKAHLTNLMRKLGVESRVEAALVAQKFETTLVDLRDHAQRSDGQPLPQLQQ